MKTKDILPLYFSLLAFSSLAHDQIVHQAITSHAETVAYAESPAYTNFINTVASDRPRTGPKGAIHWMVYGSYHEDDAGKDAGGNRSYNHFYDPLDTSYGKGLSEVPTIYYRWPIGKNSFVWGSVLNCPGIDFGGLEFGAGQNVNTFNAWSWKYARICEYSGLTASSQSVRQQALDNMFRSVGQVMHLLEDTTSPQHVRNEQHVTLGYMPSPWKSSIETWGLKNRPHLNYGDGSMLDWRGDGFTKLEDFWDRHKYNGDATKLNADLGGGPNTLGLAEWCNGNFLGARHQYAEYYPLGDICHYPYPSLAGTDYQQVRSQPPSGIDGITLLNGNLGQAIYLAKTGNGIPITHQSRVTFLGAMFPNQPGPSSTTIDDPKVLSDYHNQLIPKAVKYSAGLLDYFFRGTLDVGPGNKADGTPCLIITNTSSQDFHGGTFHLFYDDITGVRIELTGANFSATYSGTLLSGKTIIADYVPQPAAASYTLVYQGTIGAASGPTSDTVDSGIAIAATKICFRPGLDITGDTTGGLPAACDDPLDPWGAVRQYPVTVKDGTLLKLTLDSSVNCWLNLLDANGNCIYNGTYDPADTGFYLSSGSYILEVESDSASPGPFHLVGIGECCDCDGNQDVGNLDWSVDPASDTSWDVNASGGHIVIKNGDLETSASVTSSRIIFASASTLNFNEDMTYVDEFGYNAVVVSLDGRIVSYQWEQGGYNGHLVRNFNVDVSEGCHILSIWVFSDDWHNGFVATIGISPLTHP